MGEEMSGSGEYTAEERAAILDRMRAVTNQFYLGAVRAGCHAFIEFAGLMGEFIKVCEETEARGAPWVNANGHGANLVLQQFQVDYVREKLECIYGEQVLSPPETPANGA
jgi:hypothetical protein